MTHQHPGPGAARDAMNTDCGFCQDNLDAFALGALRGTERSRVEQHLLWCGPCRRLHAEIRRITDFLPFLSHPAVPSETAKTRLFERIAADRADVPANPAVNTNPWISTEPVSRPKRETRNNAQAAAWQRWIAPGLIAPLAICLVVLSAWANSLQNELSVLRSAEASPTNAVVPAPPPSDMQLYAFRPACETCGEKQASGQLGGNPGGNTGIVVAWDLDPNEKHQVWCVDSQGQKRLVTDLRVQRTGSVVQTVSFPHPIGGYEQIYVARHDGTADPDAELLVAMNEQHKAGALDVTPETP